MATKKRLKGGPSAAYVNEMKDWQAESDLRTLIEAKTIEKDPKRYAAAQALAKTRMMDMAAVAVEDEPDEDD